MKTFGIRDLRNDTASVIAEADEAGEVLISNRGRVVARLVSVREKVPMEDFLAWLDDREAIDTGWSDEFLADKQFELDEVEPEPWE